MAVDAELIAAADAVWRIPPPGPANLLSDPRFLALGEALTQRHGGGKAPFALSNALRGLGLPCAARSGGREGAGDPATIAAALDIAFAATTTFRRHLCPLEYADELPAVSFGPARIARFEAGDLERLFDSRRLDHVHTGRPLDFGRLSQLQWLVVEETVAVDPRPEARAVPFLFERMDRDFGAFDPLARRYSAAVEGVLFCLLLAPWEDWSTMLEVDWRGFRLPWVYTADADLAVQPATPPDTSALGFEPVIYQDRWGEEVEDERPTVLPLEERFSDQFAGGVQDTWRKLEVARASDLFQTPIEHFAVRAYGSSGIDELLAHMTVLEAALGEEADHERKLRPKPDRTLGATERMARKVAGLLGDPSAAQAYRDLFNIRSLFVHGRVGLTTISTEQKVMARRLSRRVANALLDRAAAGAPARPDLLAQLLVLGTP
jgi:hypothetical protein